PPPWLAAALPVIERVAKRLVKRIVRMPLGIFDQAPDIGNRLVVSARRDFFDVGRKARDLAKLAKDLARAASDAAADVVDLPAGALEGEPPVRGDHVAHIG